jgi:hypothetical protein
MSQIGTCTSRVSPPRSPSPRRSVFATVPKLNGFKAPDVEHLHVRQTAHRDGSLIIRPGDPDGIYVLVTGQCPTFTIVGWIHSSDAKQPHYWRSPDGGPGAWFVPQRKLSRRV